MPVIDLGYHFAGAADEIFARAQSDDVKTRLRENAEAAMKAGIFGAPAFVAADGELFWGDDRFEQALDRARRMGVK